MRRLANIGMLTGIVLLTGCGKIDDFMNAKQVNEATELDEKQPDEATNLEKERTALNVEIQAAISNLACLEDVDCAAAAWGYKACGGPADYVLYSRRNLSISENDLQGKFLLYAELERELSSLKGEASTCSLALEPAVKCEQMLCVKTEAIVSIPVPEDQPKDEGGKEKPGDASTEIKDLVADLSCVDHRECAVAAFGSKSCGGPASYLVYSRRNLPIREDLLLDKIQAYNHLAKEYNEASGIVSDCSFVMAPTVQCVQSRCSEVQDIMPPYIRP